MATDPSEDSEVQALLDHARNVTIIFATVEWIELYPDFVKGVEEVLRKLAPGETLGSAFPLDSSAPSGLSGLPVPPTFHTSPPSGSGVPEPDPAGGCSDPVVHSPRPRRTRLLEAHPSSPAAAVVAARKALFVLRPGKRPADWVTVRHPPRNFPVFLDNLPPSASAASRGGRAARLRRPSNPLTPLVILV